MENENYKAVSPTEVAEKNHHLPGSMDIDEDAEAKERLTSSDPTKVKFISANSTFAGRKNGDAKVDIENVQRNVGMGKEELMKYANEPFWVRLRMTLFVFFWIVWFAMLIGSVVIIVFAPRCPPAPRLDWWQKTVPYQVLVSSFKDGNNDGIGDLQGLTSKLDYFKDIGIDSLLLSPVYPSESADNIYDITDFKEIHSEYGTMQDFEDLVTAMKTRGQKLVMEFVPNQSGDKHPWFEKSINRQEPYTDYYIWADPKPGTASSPPNNWKSVVGGPAWSFHEVRKQFYLHQFHGAQPDLNLHNPQVKEELKKILEFWLNKGVDGFRVQAASFLIEDAQLRDEPAKRDATPDSTEYDYLDHIYTKHQPESLELLEEWRQLLNNYSSANGSHRVFIAELTESANNSMAYYGNESNSLVDIPLNPGLLQLNTQSTGHDILGVIETWVGVMPSSLWPNWVLGNQDNSRLATRVGPEMLDALHMVTLMSKGTPIVYYGDELGMEDVHISDGEARDRLKKDKVRTPMQWDNSSMGGFTESTHPWLPLSDKVAQINVQNELQDSHSHLGLFKSLLKLRSQAAIEFGAMQFPLVTDEIFSMMRVRKGLPGYLVVVNTSKNSTEVNLSGHSKMLPESARLEIASRSAGEGHLSDSGHHKTYLNKVALGPKQGAIFSFVPKFP